MATSPDDREAVDDDIGIDIEPDYDFRSLRGATRGKYATRYRERLRIVRIAEDVSGAFADEDEVNAALREYLGGKRQREASNPA
jgi:hypothetical protein